MLKVIVFTAILSMFLVSGGLLTLALWEGFLYSESLAIEQDIRESCKSPLCSPPVVFTSEHLLNLVVRSSGAAAAAAGGIILLVKRNKWLASNGSTLHQESNS